MNDTAKLSSTRDVIPNRKKLCIKYTKFLQENVSDTVVQKLVQITELHSGAQGHGL